MRTTLTIDDDVLAAVKGLADRQRKSAGEMISQQKHRNGVPLLPVTAHAKPVTSELVNQLRDEWPA